ncbi:GntR family transcriptional regulator [Shewanella sp. D64]|uniref:GntR family transcriptional regulator n=1 Tax=unclassified Shewanella TaxID=196818 RepID=UPI0022BA626D|nr:MULTISPECIES: GntR family transcriptional regulator [unclassified Shewanella]MEC4726464.1 GntR family transcriptional regulator [Shewanella sp. D64]MEC4738476.1 GntR family transcriptional regulator [Shewanella sp. E94]WBJ94123.1 GntR family transcriptional regulator [Shewanella sp. MTB7]
MSNKTYLFKQSINRMLQHIADLPSGQNIMANDIELTKLLSISRTTVRACVEHLCEMGVIKRSGPNKLVLRQATKNDYYDIEDKNSTKDVQIEKYFLNLINTGKLLPGDRFSELNLAQNSGCTTITVREFLIKFSSNGLIEKIPRGRWKMVKFDEDFAHELVLFRQMVEMRAITELLKQPKEDPIWHELTQLLLQHQAVRADIKNRYLEFPDLDKALHYAIKKSTRNRFVNQFYDIVSFVCHYHYQWDKTGEFERFTVAIDEHIDILNNLVTHNTAGAIMSMEKHLQTAEITLLRCVHGLEH